MFSITFALLISGTVFKYWFEYEAKSMMEQATIAMDKAKKEREHDRLVQNKISEQKALQRKEKQKLANIQREKQQRIKTAENERKIRARKTALETCVFWQKQYKKYNTKYEKRMMNTACKS